MLITTLIITACLQDVEGKLTKECKDHHVDIFDEKMTVPKCQSEAMINFPKWTEEHPGWCSTDMGGPNATMTPL